MQQGDQIIASIIESTNYYDILNIDRTARSDDVRKAYLHRSKFTHPDKSNNPLAHDAFHKLKHAYEVLKSPISRQSYDTGLFDGTGIDPTTGLFPTDWAACLQEIFEEFMKSNYEPVLAVIDYFPELTLSRETMRSYLHPLRNMLSAAKVRYDLVQPEIKQLQELRTAGPISFFDVSGRLTSSVKTTKLFMIILQKSIEGDGTDDNAADDEGTMGESSATPTTATTTTALDNSALVPCIKNMISIMNAAEERLDAVNNWSWRSMFS
eukprot:Partr_v1_DN25134_c1_g1_i1_m76987 putative DnaJ